MQTQMRIMTHGNGLGSFAPVCLHTQRTKLKSFHNVRGHQPPSSILSRSRWNEMKFIWNKTSSSLYGSGPLNFFFFFFVCSYQLIFSPINYVLTRLTTIYCMYIWISIQFDNISGTFDPLQRYIELWGKFGDRKFVDFFVVVLLRNWDR